MMIQKSLLLASSTQNDQYQNNGSIPLELGVCVRVYVCAWPLRGECLGLRPQLPLAGMRSWRSAVAPSCWSSGGEARGRG